jgi:uncharacterized membrane protein
MPLVGWGMTVGGIAALVVGLMLVRGRFRAASGAERWIVLGPVFEAVALTMFAAEHFFLAPDMVGMVPKWIPGALFWTYFVGVGLLAAAVSFIAGRWVKWAGLCLALFFLLVVVTIDLPLVHGQAQERLFWTLTVRETCFAGGALVLAGSAFARESRFGEGIVRIGRAIVALTMIFYGGQHFLFPRFVPGVPLEKPMPAWVPAPVVLAFLVGAVLVVGGVALFNRRAMRYAAAGAGAALVLLTVFFYIPMLVMQVHSAALEGLNYVGDTLLFAATILLAGFAADRPILGAA